MRPLLVALLVAGAVRSAAADGTTFQGNVLTAQAAERTAHESKDPAAYEVCGHAYVEVANQARTEMPDFVPEAMYNAAVCFEAGGSIGAAITLHKRLEDEFKTHKLVSFGLARRASMYMRMGWYAEAAKELETFAAKYAGERDASDALENAMRLRAALGDEDAARADAERWIKLFGAKRPREAAQAAWWLAWRARERGEGDEAVRAYQEWLKRFAGKAERHQVAAAYLAIGELQWDASCKVKGTAKGGLCLGRTRSAGEPRCGAAPLVAVARDATLAREATAALKQAIRAAETSGDDMGRMVADRARLVLADAQLEAVVAMTLPAAAVDAWIKMWQDAMADANRSFEALLRSRDARVTVTAVGRMAWLAQHASDTLAGAPLPVGAKKKPAFADELKAAYCDKMLEVAEPLRVRALDAATTCLAKAGDLGVVDETAPCVGVFDRQTPAAAGAGERLPAAAAPRVRDVEPEIRYRPRGVTPSPP